MVYRDVSSEIQQVAASYHYQKPPALVESIRDLLLQLLRMFLQILHDLFQHNGGTSDARSLSFLIQFAVYFCGVLAIIALAYLLFKRIRTVTRVKRSTVRGAIEVEELLDASGWKTQADRLAAAQQYKPACRAVYLSLLQDMHEHHIADFAPAKTNYEYAYSLAKYPRIQSDFRQLSALVETIWFGNKEASRDDYDASVGILQGLHRSIEQSAADKERQKQAGT